MGPTLSLAEKKVPKYCKFQDIRQILLSYEIDKKYQVYGTFPGIGDDGEIKYWMHGVFVSFSVNFWMKKYGQKCIFSEMTSIYIPDAGHDTIWASSTF